MRHPFTVLFPSTALSVLLATACSGGPSPAAPAATVHTALTFAGFSSEQVRQAAQRYPDIALVPEAPLSLTTSDGTGLELVRLRGRAVVDGPLAFTELHLRFRNPEPRVLEGRFSITLPDGAAISRLAMSIDGAWQEAEVVERQLAHRAYEDFLHRRQDPALLEKEAGNQFRARVFPIPASGVKDLIISYSHVLPSSSESFSIPLQGLPAIADLDLVATVRDASGKRHETTLKRSAFKPERDFTAPVAAGVGALRSGRHAVVRVRPAIESDASSLGALTILFDTSASRAPGFARSITDLGALVASLRQRHGAELALDVVAFDQQSQLIYSGRADGFGKKQLELLRARRPLGASNLAGALDWLASRKPRERLLLVSDGIATAGETEAGAIGRALARLTSVKRLDMLLTGGIRDRELATALVRDTLPTDGAIIDGDATIAEKTRRISLATRSGIQVAVDGAAWTWPTTLDGVQPGDEIVVFAAMRSASLAPLTVRLRGGIEQTDTVAVAPAVAPLLGRSIAAADIARLAARRARLAGKNDQAERARLKKRIIDISTEHRVLSDFTALLVLETDDDYARFGIKRAALSKIMTIGERGIELVARNEVLTIAGDKPDQPTADLKDKEKNNNNNNNNRTPPPTEATKTTGLGSAAGADGDGESVIEPHKKVGARQEQPGDAAVAAPMPKPAPTTSLESSVDLTDAQDAGDDDDDDADEAEPMSQGGRTTAREEADGPEDDEASEASEFERNLRASPPAFTGRMAVVMSLVDKQDSDGAIAEALAWRNDEPGDVMALVALGAGLELAGNHSIAARAYGSIIDLFPSRADLRRFAGARIQRLRGGADLANDTFAKAVAQRPDHLTGYRLWAYALVRAGLHARAFDVVESGLAREFPDGRFSGGKRILRADLEIIAAALVANKPSSRAAIEKRLAVHGLVISTTPSLRFVLNWETDANDVDFHIFDGKGGHAYYSNKQLPSGGELYEDITDGYGPECFAIEGEAHAFPYRLQIHYYSRGPMGYGMGQVEILDHDGKGNLMFQERPFVVMNDSAYLDLGQVGRPTQTSPVAVPAQIAK